MTENTFKKGGTFTAKKVCVYAFEAKSINIKT